MNTPMADGANREPTATNDRSPAEQPGRSAGRSAGGGGAFPARRRTVRRKGKIGRLPHAVREELNRRLLDGEAGGSLLAWLNGLPGPRDGRAITKQNLSEWRKGGWEDWVERRESRERMDGLAEEVKAIEGVAEGRRFTDLASSMAGLELGLLLQAVRRMEHGAEKTRAVLQIVRELVRLRTSDREAERAQCGAEAPHPQETEGVVASGSQMPPLGVRTKRLEVKPLHLPATDASVDVQDGPRKLGQIREGVKGEGNLKSREGADVATCGVGAPRLQKTEGAVEAALCSDENASVTESGRKAPSTAQRLGVKPLHLAATDASVAVQGSQRKLGRIRKGVKDEGILKSREGADVATRGVRAPRLQEMDGPHRENSDSFSFCPGAGGEVTIVT